MCIDSMRLNCRKRDCRHSGKAIAASKSMAVVIRRK
jgi:hypothetical protein